MFRIRRFSQRRSFHLHIPRVQLDEAHSIKERATNTAKACFELDSSYKWCLSGTPLQNRVGELYSMIRFLGGDPFAFYFCKSCLHDPMLSHNLSLRQEMRLQIPPLEVLGQKELRWYVFYVHRSSDVMLKLYLVDCGHSPMQHVGYWFSV